ncbi:MAG: galactose-1-phosphate uridylyltransferase [bacterium]
MGELRRHPFIGEWVVICPELGSNGKGQIDGKCKYCDSDGVSEVFRLGGNNQHGWMLRVIRCEPCIFNVDCGVEKRAAGVCDVMEAAGVYEILIDSPLHGVTFADLSFDHAAKVIETLKMRHADLGRDERLRHAFIFKIQDLPARADSHSCWHIVGTPFISTEIKQELRKAREYFSYKERCVICDYIRDEARKNLRLIYENDDFVVYVPFAARFPYEIWILPRSHSADFYQISERQVQNFAQVLKVILDTIGKLPSSGYLLQIHSAPYIGPRTGSGDRWQTLGKDYHWHAEIRPKIDLPDELSKVLGFYINHINPEVAADRLRSIIQGKI